MQMSSATTMRTSSVATMRTSSAATMRTLSGVEGHVSKDPNSVLVPFGFAQGTDCKCSRTS